MARRRLSDLLREEANKPSDETAATTEAEQSADEPDVEAVDAADETLASEPSTATKASTVAKSRSTKQTAAAEPKETSEPKQDDALLQKIADLTAAIESHKVTIETLETELEQTRKETRQLKDSNTKLTQELKALQAKKTAADTSALAKASESHPPQELKLAPPPSLAEPAVSLKSFNRDVGWFD